MKIAVLTDGIYPFVIGGIQRHSLNLIKHLVELNIEVIAFHTIPGKTLLSEQESQFFKGIEKVDWQFIPFPKTNSFPGHYLRESYLYSCTIYDKLRSIPDIDLIYAQGFTGWKCVESKSKSPELPPVAVHFHGYEMFQKSDDIRSRLSSYMLRSPVKYIINNADYVFSFGGHIDSVLHQIGCGTEKIIHTTNGVESGWLSAPISESSQEVRRFVFIGRYERRKGVEELNKVLNDLIKEPKLKWEISFIGPIPFSKRINNSRVKYLGSISDSEQIKTVLSQSDVLLCPSLAEGMPTVILEAMSRGLAVIATDVGAVSVMVNAENGWLIEAGNTDVLKEAMTQAISLGQDALFAKKLSSYNKVKTSFLWSAVAKNEVLEFNKFLTVES